jgi:hypothetical protein
MMFRLGLIIHNHPIPEDFTSFQLEYLESGQNFDYSGYHRLSVVKIIEF